MTKVSFFYKFFSDNSIIYYPISSYSFIQSLDQSLVNIKKNIYQILFYIPSRTFISTTALISFSIKTSGFYLNNSFIIYNTFKLYTNIDKFISFYPFFADKIVIYLNISLSIFIYNLFTIYFYYSL